MVHMNWDGNICVKNFVMKHPGQLGSFKGSRGPEKEDPQRNLILRNHFIHLFICISYFIYCSNIWGNPAINEMLKLPTLIRYTVFKKKPWNLFTISFMMAHFELVCNSMVMPICINLHNLWIMMVISVQQWRPQMWQLLTLRWDVIKFIALPSVYSTSIRKFSMILNSLLNYSQCFPLPTWPSVLTYFYFQKEASLLEYFICNTCIISAMNSTFTDCSAHFTKKSSRAFMSSQVLLKFKSNWVLLNSWW